MDDDRLLSAADVARDLRRSPATVAKAGGTCYINLRSGCGSPGRRACSRLLFSCTTHLSCRFHRHRTWFDRPITGAHAPVFSCSASTNAG